MAIYHYKDSPLIEQVKIDTSHHGIARATIVTAANADGKVIENLRQQLGSHGFSTLMDSCDGRTAIQVRGFKDASKLLLALHKLGLSNGEIKVEKTAEDKAKLGFQERVRGKALFLSALFYNLGNIACIISGIRRGRHNPGGKMTSHDKSEMGIGAAFAMGDVLMTFFGHDKGDEELEAANQGLKRYLHKKGIEIPRGDALNPDSLHKSGAFKATSHWLRKHIVHIKCLTETAGGLFTIHAGLKPYENKGRKGEWGFNHGKLVAGLLLTTGWFSTFLLDRPQGHHIFDDDNNSGSLIDKVTGNPRGWMARPFSMGNNMSNLWGALNPHTGERKELQGELFDAKMEAMFRPTAANHAEVARVYSKRNDYICNVITACSFLIANMLFGMSDNKRLTKTEDDKMIMSDMVLLSANVLAKQPEAVRNASIAETADYVSQLAHVRMTRDQVERAIRDKITSLTQSRWADRVQTTSPTTPTLPGHI